MATAVVPVRAPRDLRRFLTLPRSIYRGNPCWVSPLLADQRRDLADALLPGDDGSRALFLALRDGRPAGRIAAIVDRTLNATKQSQTGYFSLFECVDDRRVAAALFDAAGAWLKARGLTVLKGPVSPDGPHGDDCKGLLVDAFDRPPVLMTSYNPPYYQGLIEGCGFAKDFDVYAYLLDKDRLFNRDPGKVIEYAERRYKFRLDTINLARLDDEIRAVKHVLDLAVPAEWPDMIAPSLEELQAMAKRMKPIADPDFVVIARAGDEPVGFGIALPDYNQVLIHLNGRMTPLAILKYLYYRRKITWARIFIMFVVPTFRKKGVAHAIYYHIFLRGTGKGYTHGEGSTIGEPNTQMRTDMESIGGQKYKTYRIYRKEL
jgi:GNAT superfamily N-acetyltransferase